MLTDLTAEYPTAPKDKLEKVLSCAYALASPESNELGLHSFPIENIPTVAKLIVSTLLLFKMFVGIFYRQAFRNKEHFLSYMNYYGFTCFS